MNRANLLPAVHTSKKKLSLPQTTRRVDGVRGEKIRDLGFVTEINQEQMASSESDRG
jgi:hypothetical protein